MVAHRVRPLGGHCYDSLFPTGEWRNWQTRRIHAPVSLTGRAGSTPPSPTLRRPGECGPHKANESERLFSIETATARRRRFESRLAHRIDEVPAQSLVAVPCE